MTQKTKLEIIGPYTPEHEGPFCTRDGEVVELKIRNARGKYPVVGYIGDEESLSEWTENGLYIGGKETHILNLMNAREVPVAREFWINEYGCNSFGCPYETLKEAEDALGFSRGRTIHVREVLPGEE